MCTAGGRGTVWVAVLAAAALLLPSGPAFATDDKPPVDEPPIEDPPAQYAYDESRAAPAPDRDLGGLLAVVSACDDCSQQVTLPFMFNFYGYDQTTVFVAANGVLSFAGPIARSANSAAETRALYAIAPLWDDWDNRGVGEVFYRAGPDEAVFTWRTQHFPAASFPRDVVEFQAILFRDGRIRLNYGENTNPDWTSATIGISSADPPWAYATDVTESRFIPSFLYERRPDDTPPVVTPNVSGTLGKNGWYVSGNVTVSWTIDDPESPIFPRTVCGPSVLNADTAGATFTCSATSSGGTGSSSVTIKRDATVPSVTPEPSRAPDANGWYNHAFSVAWTGTDATSGIDACSAKSVYDGPDTAAGEVSGSCTDVAGNSASASYAFAYDATAPAVSCSTATTALWPPNHRLVSVQATVEVLDLLSGPSGFRLDSATSNEADADLGGSDAPNDVQGVELGTPDTLVLLRAERSGTGTGRVYTLTYTGTDRAGNEGTCAATTVVPHDLGKT